MSTVVHLKNIEDTRKLVQSWLNARVHVEEISEDTEDNIMWMRLTSSLGRLQLRRDVYPTNLETRPSDVWNRLDKIPGSPYAVSDNSCMRPERQEVIDQYELLWQKYFHKDWKNLDFLLGQRGPSTGNVKEPSWKMVFVGVSIALVMVLCIIIVVLLK